MSFGSRFPTVGQHLAQFRFALQVCQSSKNITQVFELVDLVTPRTAQEREEHARRLASSLVAEKKPILASQRQLTQQSFAGVVVDGERPVRAVQPQGILIVDTYLLQQTRRLT